MWLVNLIDFIFLNRESVRILKTCKFEYEINLILLQLQCRKEKHDHLYYGLELIHGIQRVDLELCGLKLYHGTYLKLKGLAESEDRLGMQCPHMRSCVFKNCTQLIS